jgi:hypothetical protein
MKLEREDFPDDWTDVDIQQYKDNRAVVLSALDQVRSGLDLTWREISYARMQELAERIIAIGYDFNVFDAMLVGTYLGASARSQIKLQEQQAEQEFDAKLREEQGDD